VEINEAEGFVYGWRMWERGRLDGIAMAIEIVEKSLRRGDTNAEEREVLMRLHDALQEAKSHCAVR
jgi:hypothetical protein